MSFSLQAAELDFRMIPLQHRFPQDILLAIQQVVGPEGSVSTMDYHLVVRATPEDMAVVEALVERLDAIQRNMYITISHEEHSPGMGVTENDTVNDVDVSQVAEKDEIGSAPIESHSMDIHKSERFLTVQDGEQIFICVNEQTTLNPQWEELMTQYLTEEQTVALDKFATGFAVRFRYIGNEIEVEVTPRIVRQYDDHDIDFEHLSSVVRVGRGQWLDINAVMWNHDQMSREILFQHQYAESRNKPLQIKVD
ncbi:nodulation protein NolW [Methylobacillus rhizosphaerae]|uniref:nodulation protein NolW n=1 Tax=Methylobacillus rhizosphaerae TaxID=551994 RepID=UPI00117CEC36|nr:nodulation protein NolW [Methylobacillus rhizosphaerae]